MHADFPATTTPLVRDACAQILPPSVITTACGDGAAFVGSQLSTTFTSRLSVTRRLSPLHATPTLARISYLMLAGPKLMEDGEDAGIGNWKKNVVWPRRAA